MLQTETQLHVFSVLVLGNAKQTGIYLPRWSPLLGWTRTSTAWQCKAG
jgi:hypothetical protein